MQNLINDIYTEYQCYVYGSRRYRARVELVAVTAVAAVAVLVALVV